jgi:hypothetical protein
MGDTKKRVIGTSGRDIFDIQGRTTIPVGTILRRGRSIRTIMDETMKGLSTISNQIRLISSREKKKKKRCMLTRKNGADSGGQSVRGYRAIEDKTKSEASSNRNRRQELQQSRMVQLKFPRR